MAKGSPFTTFTGKLGQTVGFIIKNSASKQVQGIRAYQSQVANPKSVLQSNQRLVMKPLNNIARALKPIIERGFEGVKYGAQSRQRFLSLNMADFNGPYLVKGDERAVPGPFLISQGSLVPVGIYGVQMLNALPTIHSDIFLGDGAISPAVINNRGSLSQRIIANNSDIREGDQLTFIYVIEVAGSYVYRTESIIVDTAATDGVVVEFASGGGSYLQFGALSLYKTSTQDLYYSIGYNADESVVAAAVIQSREGETRYERSNSTLWVSDAIRSEFMSAEALEAAINSYSATAGTTDWPEEKSDSNIVLRDVSTLIRNSYLNHEFAEGWIRGVKGYLTEGGQIGYYLRVITEGTRYQPVNADGVGLTYTEDGVTNDLLLNSAGIEAIVNSGLWKPVLQFGDVVSA